MTDAVALVPLFPLLAVLVNLFIGKRLSKKAVGILACGAVGASLGASVLAVAGLMAMEVGHRSVEVILFPWIVSGGFQVPIGFLLDPLSAVMILVVTGVGFLIHVYSTGYMHEDAGFARYFLFLNLFVFAMLLLVLGNSYLLLFIGWEGVGLCSYLLIGFWFTKDSASDAGKKAFIVNRVGDFGFILGMLLIVYHFGTLHYGQVFARAPELFHAGDLPMVLITALLFVGAMGKSAQLPLHVWLPDAMEGPTPVSALIHAATMVTAGVYMVCRSSALYELAPVILSLVAVIGCLTAFFAGTIALVQNDIKRVLAYSTVSQLGYMFLAAGVGAYVAAIFHLVTHAFFKALLFLGSGSVIHALHEEQDIRKMGGLKKYMPTTHRTFVIGSLAIAGIPPLAGFMSKDEILYEVFNAGKGTGWVLLWIGGIVTALMTAFYMFRLVYLTFYGESRMDEEVEKHVHESPPPITVPLTILAVLSAVGGFLGIPVIKKWNIMHNWLGEAFHAAAEHTTEAATHAASAVSHLTVELGLMTVSVVVAVSGILIARTIILRRPALAEKMRNDYSFLYSLFLNKWWVDELYDLTIVNPLKRFADMCWSVFDVKGIDGTVNGTAKVANVSGGVLRKLQTGFVQNYALGIVIGLALMLVLAFF
ncbi:MAG: NADH-quinone oxidoreductase subunit L [bacterium]|nr:MAG: NADH-quinone oxidoreductase subunit L [bacterium]